MRVLESFSAHEPLIDGQARASSVVRAFEAAATPFAGALCLLLLVAFLAVPYLPMVDLPQHSAQISIWLHLGDSSFVDPEHFTVNLRTPYLTAYLLGLGLASWVGVVPALKLVAWLSVVLHWALFSLLVRQLDYPRWLGSVGLPLGLGYGFYFGFLSFNVAVPLALLALSAALWHRERPTWQTGLVLGGALSATLASHGFAFGPAAVLVFPVLLRGGGALWLRLAPLLAPALLALAWLIPGASVQSIGATIWQPRIDLHQIPALLLGVSAADKAASALGVGFLVIVALCIRRPSEHPEQWAPLLLVLLGYCLFPISQNGFGPLHPRFAAFVVPALLLAFEPTHEPRFSKLPALAIVLCVAWFGLFSWRLADFARETRAIAAFVAQAPAALRVRPIVFERNSQAFPGLPALLHLPAYYAAEKGGFQGYSFAMYPTSVVRYTASVPRGMAGGAEWQPEQFSVEDELPLYDLVLVHSSSDRSSQLFGKRIEDLECTFHERGWWAYRVRSSVRTRPQL